MHAKSAPRLLHTHRKNKTLVLLQLYAFALLIEPYINVALLWACPTSQIKFGHWIGCRAGPAFGAHLVGGWVGRPNGHLWAPNARP